MPFVAQNADSINASIGFMVYACAQWLEEKRLRVGRWLHFGDREW
jgi:hypothetical protein